MELILKLASLLPFYLVGAFPTGRLLAARQGIKLEEHGSGNVGATNVARALGKRAGLTTLLIDVGKGFFAVLVADFLTEQLSYVAIAGLAVVAGHCISLPGTWRGGKGVATALGVYLYIQPAAALFGLGSFIIVLTFSRMVSLASIIAALLIPVYCFFLHLPTDAVLPLCLLSLLVVIRHKENLRRITQGKERKIGIAHPSGELSSSG